jgi:predicted dehydrogenase
VQGEIGWGIIGCGDVVARKSGAALGAVAGSRLVAVMRRDPERLRAAAARLGAPVATTAAAELIAHPDVSAVYIATPPQHHLEYALAVAAAGKACLVEKPAGRSDVELARMVEAFDDAGAPLYVSYYRRYLSRFRAVKAVLDSGDLGALVAVQYTLAKPPRPDTWRLSAASGGGHFYDLAGHVLDLFDDWFGPLELTGSSARNVLPAHDTEDVVAITFQTESGLIGSANWNFAASAACDELVIEGMHGRLRLAAMSTSGPIHIEKQAGVAARRASTIAARAVGLVRAQIGLADRHRVRFRRDDGTHVPMMRAIVPEIAAAQRGEAAPASPTAALRTARIANRALEKYYGGRGDAFWAHPERFASLRTRASRRTARPSPYRLSEAEIARFDEQGFLGPFRCEAPWQGIDIPVKKGRNQHLDEPAVFEICTHPSVVHRAAQLLRRPQVALFKSRFVVKVAGHNAEVAWHQDVGPTNGGYYPDGTPVPSVTAWMALDRVTAANGAVKVLPGSHKQLVGEFDKRIRAELLEKGEIDAQRIASAVTFELEPGEFYLFHSWLLHGSDASNTPGRRAGLNMRYVAAGDEYDEFEYINLDCAASVHAAVGPQ